ncbi:MAG TPA: methyltransferase domain-containing protein [Solirubrobacterales bacterium]|nr:methyltransferase domain-containing protein [Solirubrobacterales bacterium]
MDLAEYRSASLDTWNRFAANWDEERSFLWGATRGVSERMVAGLDPSPGDTVLELAAGTGETGFLVAERLGDDGRVISTDFAPSMVDAARRRAEELGLDRFEFRVLDAENMDLDDDSVDGVVCRFGYMLMADPAAALVETRRVLRDGGRLAFAVWASPLQNAWAAIPGMTMVELGYLPPPEPDGPGIFGLADPDRIRQLVTGAGFGDPTISQVSVEWSYDTPEDHWEKTLKLAAPIAEAYGAIDPDERERVKQTVAERVRGAIAGDGLGGLVHVVVAS